MDPGTVVRDDLRSYALRRCIRFYTAILLVALAMVSSQQGIDRVNANEIFTGIAVLLAVLAAVEVSAGVVMAQMARVRAQHPGPETPLWAFALGPVPSWLAAALFLAVAGVLWLGSR